MAITFILIFALVFDYPFHSFLEAVINYQSDAPSACIAQFQDMANHFLTNPTISNLLVDSGKGVNDLGLYKQCKESNVSRYIMFTVALGGFIPQEIGLCVPIECAPEEFTPIKPIIAMALSDALKMPITVGMIGFTDVVKQNDDYSEMNVWRYLAIIFFVAFLLIAIIGCLYDKDPKTPIAKLLSFFSLRKNASAILFSENKSDKNLDILNGARVLSMGWVILGHTLFMMLVTPLLNEMDLYAAIKNYAMSTITAGTLSVDSFFCLSGFLACFSLTQLFSKRSNINALTILMAIVKRLIRLYPIYIVMFIIIYNIAPLLGSGPVFFANSWLTTNCNERWYMNILFIDNLQKAGKMCVSWTWYLANDMQFFLVMIILAILYNISKMISIVTTLALVVGSHLTTFLLAYKNEYYIYTSDAAKNEAISDVMYFKPWTRISTYLIGTLFGWLYLANKNEEYSTRVAKAINNVWKNSPLLRYILYLIGIFLTTFMVYSYTYFFRNETTKFSYNVLYFTFSRSGFILGMMLIIFPATIGRAKPLLAVLGHQIFNSLAKVTYAVYQIHLIVISVYFLSGIQGMEYRGLFVVLKAIDGFIVSYAAGFLLTLMFESPVLQIEKFFLTKPAITYKEPTKMDDDAAPIAEIKL